MSLDKITKISRKYLQNVFIGQMCKLSKLGLKFYKTKSNVARFLHDLILNKPVELLISLGFKFNHRPSVGCTFMATHQCQVVNVASEFIFVFTFFSFEVVKVIHDKLLDMVGRIKWVLQHILTWFYFDSCVVFAGHLCHSYHLACEHVFV